MKLLVLDGNSIINRAFYGIRPLTTKDGVFTNGIYGFLNILLKLKEQVNPDGIAAAFDLKAPTFRHKMYDAYKAGRKGMPDELAMQMPLLKELLPLMGVTVLQKEGFEADDILGTLAANCVAQGVDCVLATGDRDSLQLVSEHTHVLLAATKAGQPHLTEYTPELIWEDKGVTPSQLIDVKALQGDTSDNIPGVAGVGEKTALSLIAQFGSVQNLYENIDSSDIRDTLRNKLIADKENALLSYELGKICCDMPLDVTVEQLLSAPADHAALSQKLARLELFKMIERLGLEQIPLQAEPVADAPASRYVCQPFGEVPQRVEDTVYVLSQGTVTALLSGERLYLFEDDHAAGSLLASGCGVYTHDLKAWYHRGFSVKTPAFDTALAAYLCNPSASDYGVSRLIAEYGAVGMAENAPSDYADLANTLAAFPMLCTILQEKLQEEGQADLLSKVEIPLSRVLTDMEDEGFLVDWQALTAYGTVLEEQIAALMQSIYDSVGYEFNLNSPKQLGEALFVKLGLPAKKKTKSGFSTNAEVLEELKYQHPAVAQLLEYRQLAKLKSTYVDGLLAVRGDDGRVHTTFNQTETRTGRISSSEPNLQNIPVRRENGRELRRFFTAGEGNVLVDADYSQIELRVLAHMANDEAMIQTFKSGGDIHTATAAKISNLPPELVTPLMRSRAKAVNFGIVYGIGAYSLSQDLNISFGEAKQYINNYMTTYAGVADYMKQVVETAKETGYVATLMGRRRYLPELKASNAVTRSFGERVARNMPVQGTSADIIKVAMIRVADRLDKENLQAKLILQVHDELIVEAPEDEADRVLTILQTEMEQAVALKVAMQVDAHIGKTWYDAKG
ncbi:MAG: DNA polymerase I [Clostridia bacterium]|nr:DNA polymerase I [Clostridia bacterium]